VNKQTSRLVLLGMMTLALLAVFALGVTPAAAQNEGQIAGIVFQDDNGNGIREEGEEGLQDVEVTFDSGGWNTTINTADNGAFSIDLNPATWDVSILVPAGYVASTETSEQVVLANPGDTVTNLEFALKPDPTSAGGDGEVLPASGAAISSEWLIGGLVGLLVIGIVLVVVGQRRSAGLS
jgi:hypothetical protein